MFSQQALIPKIILNSNYKILNNITAVLSGVCLITLLAQISIHLPFSPVPITGQTFGVTLIALLWGRYRAASVMGLYLSLGAMGLPIFAGGHFGLMGPSLGYLFGMLVASYVMGYFADLGWTKSFTKAWMVASLGSLITFSCGLTVLSLYSRGQSLWLIGLLPFIPGDIFKNTLAASLASGANKFDKK